MKRAALFILLFAAFTLQSVIAGPIAVTVQPAVAPNFFLSASYSTWQDNAVHALMAGLGTFGTPNTPGYFQAKAVFTAADMIVSNFPSWEAKANPGAVFGPAFANEFGDRITFATLIRDTSGSQINVSSGVTVVVPPFGTNPGFSGTGFAYTTRTVGITCVGPCSAGNFTYTTSGTGLVDAIGVFPGFGYQALAGDPLGATQANLDAVAAAIRADPGNGLIRDCTSFPGASNCGNATLSDVVPEPATFTLGAGVLLLLSLARPRPK